MYSSTACCDALLTLNAAYPSCHENHLRFGKVWRIHRVELVFKAFTNSAMDSVDGREAYRWT